MEKIVNKIEKMFNYENADRWYRDLDTDSDCPIYGNIKPVIKDIGIFIYGNNPGGFYKKHPSYNTYEDDQRNSSSKLLKNRLITFMEDFVDNGNINEDYLLKTVYGIYRHFYEYKDSSECLDNEAYLLYLVFCIEAYDERKCYNEDIAALDDTHFGVYYQILADLMWNIFYGLKGYYDQYNVILGWNNYRTPVGCSALTTNVRSYEKFRKELTDYDYWFVEDECEEYWNGDDEEKRRSIFAMPKYGLDENDREVLDLYPEIPDPWDEILYGPKE